MHELRVLSCYEIIAYVYVHSHFCTLLEFLFDIFKYIIYMKFNHVFEILNFQKYNLYEI